MHAIVMQSRKLQDAAKHLSELVGSYDPDKLAHACLKLTEVIREGELIELPSNIIIIINL